MFTVSHFLTLFIFILTQNSLNYEYEFRLPLHILSYAVLGFASVNLEECKNCHGVNFKEGYFKTSKVIANMTKQEVTDALIGYKNGTYGGAMRGIMKVVVERYSDAELAATGVGK